MAKTIDELKKLKEELKAQYKDQGVTFGIGDNTIKVYVKDEATKSSMPSEYKQVPLTFSVGEIKARILPA